MKSTIALVFLAAATLASASAQSAPAAHAWCAENSGGGTTCNYDTLDQCLATERGIGNTCRPNPAYRPQQHRP